MTKKRVICVIHKEYIGSNNLGFGTFKNVPQKHVIYACSTRELRLKLMDFKLANHLQYDPCQKAYIETRQAYGKNARKHIHLVNI